MIVDSMNYSKLNWNPLIENIKEELEKSNNPLLIIVPFIKTVPLEELLQRCNYKELKLIVRWHPADIVNKVSDLSIYETTKRKNIPLYINNLIHLKLFIYDDNTAFHTSGNLTKKGIGLIKGQNIEVGCRVVLTNEDWKKIYEVISESFLVNDRIYNTYKKKLKGKLYIRERNIPSFNMNDLVPDKEFSLDSLPAIETPEKLFDIYQNLKIKNKSKELYRKAIHDIVLYDIPNNLTENEFFELLKKEFTSKKFTKKMVNLIKRHKSMRFGGVTNWIHSNCSDVPLPYRMEIKENTKILYNWLSYFYERIRWSIPSKHSQVLFWSDK